MAGIRLLCDVAKENGILILYDDIEADNPSYKLFLKNGFEIDYKDDSVVVWSKRFYNYQMIKLGRTYEER